MLPRKYNWRLFGGDVSGGFIASLIAFPYGLAMAAAMGLPPILGIFTSILTAPITALLGRNPVMIGGASSVTIPFIAVAVRAQGIGGAAKVSIVAAVLMLVFSTLRLGRYVAKVPHPVMAGFSCGIGGMMVISQLRTMLGLNSVPGLANLSMAEQLTDAVASLGQMHWTTAATAIVVIAVATVSARVSHRLPAPLLGIGLAILISNAFGWTPKEVGWLSSSIPPFVGFKWDPSDVYTVLPAAFGLAFVSSVNLLVTSRVVEHFRGRHKHLKQGDADRELGAYGIANLTSGMFGAPMSVGIPARSLANVQCGGSSRISNLAHALFLLFFAVEGTRFIAHIPLAALAAVTAWMGVRLMEWSTWSRLPKMRRVDAGAFLATALSALFLNAVFAVALGCSLYVLERLYRNHFFTLQLPYTEKTPGTPLA
ncbi:MAG: SulP family inorganic anion transporter [Bryobacteraceae bacterium]